MTTEAQQILAKSVTEAQLQGLVVDYLRSQKYIVLETGKYFAKPKANGSDCGLADLVIHDPVWPAGMNLCIELKIPGKSAGTKIDPNAGYSQEYLEEMGHSIVCHTLEEVIEALETFEEVLP